MEPTPARTLRALLETCPSRPPRTAREKQRHAYILDAGARVFAARGRASISMKDFSNAISRSPSTIRRDVCDLHYLFFLVLRGHLDNIRAAITAIPGSSTDVAARRRAAYLAATRNAAGATLPIHLLLTREKFLLPPDELARLEGHREVIGLMLGGRDWELTLSLLDNPHLSAARIEATMAALGIPKREAVPAVPQSAPADLPPQVRPAPGPAPRPPVKLSMNRQPAALDAAIASFVARQTSPPPRAA